MKLKKINKTNRFYILRSLFIYLFYIFGVNSVGFCQRDSILYFIPNASNVEIEYWNWVNKNSFGVYGFTPERDFIDRYSAVKFWRANWIPVDGFKHIMKGKIINFQGHQGDLFNEPEEDWNIHISTNDSFQYMINYPEMITKKKCKWFKDEVTGSYLIESEITPYRDFSYLNDYFQLYENQNNSFLDNLANGFKIWDRFIELFGAKTITGNLPYFENKKNEVCFYGPWVREYLHDYRPEIHPIQLIWWKENIRGEESYTLKKYTLIGLQDITEFFNEIQDFKTNYDTPIPWAERIMKTQFSLAFKLKKKKESINFEIKPHFMNINSVKNLDEVNYYKDSTGRNISSYKYEFFTGNTIKINVDTSISKFVKIEPEAVRFLNDSTIIGFINIISKINSSETGDRSDQGYFIFEVLASKFNSYYSIFSDTNTNLNNINSIAYINSDFSDSLSYIVNNLYSNLTDSLSRSLGKDESMSISLVESADFIFANSEILLDSILDIDSNRITIENFPFFSEGIFKYKLKNGETISKTKPKIHITTLLKTKIDTSDKKDNSLPNTLFADKISLGSQIFYVYKEFPEDVDLISDLSIHNLNKIIYSRDKEKIKQIFGIATPFKTNFDSIQITDLKNKKNILFYKKNIKIYQDSIEIMIPDRYKLKQLEIKLKGLTKDNKGNSNKFTLICYNFLSECDEEYFISKFSEIYGDRDLGLKMWNLSKFESELNSKSDKINADVIKSRIVRLTLERMCYENEYYEIREIDIENLKKLVKK